MHDSQDEHQVPMPTGVKWFAVNGGHRCFDLAFKKDTSAPALRQNCLYHVSVNVGQTPLDAVVVEAQPLVVETENLQDRGVEVVDGRDVFDRLVAEFIGRRRS